MASNPTEEAGKVVGAVIAGILGLAIIAVIVGRNAQTSNVISAGGGALSSVVGAAVAPVSSGTSSTLPASPTTLLTGTGITGSGFNNGSINGGFGNMSSILGGMNGVTNLSNPFDTSGGFDPLNFDAFGSA